MQRVLLSLRKLRQILPSVLTFRRGQHLNEEYSNDVQRQLVIVYQPLYFNTLSLSSYGKISE